MLILDLWGVSFHAVVVFGLGKDFLFKSTLGHCGGDSKTIVNVFPNLKKMCEPRTGVVTILIN